MKTRLSLVVGFLACSCGSVTTSVVTRDAGAPLVCPLDAPKTCTAPAPTFAGVTPILNRACAACHSSTDGGGPWPLTNYEDVSAWQAIVRYDLVNCTMPPLDGGITISSEDRAALLNWLDCGLKQ
jgi:cytochrome c5